MSPGAGSIRPQESGLERRTNPPAQRAPAASERKGCASLLSVRESNPTGESLRRRLFGFYPARFCPKWEDPHSAVDLASRNDEFAACDERGDSVAIHKSTII